MAFMHQGQNIRIQGDPSLVKSTISAKTLMRLVENKVEAMSILWIVEKEQRHVEILTEQDEELYSLLEEFTQVFAEPTWLPPYREVGHKIPIKVGVESINIRPHRYPHLQKNEIEKQVKEVNK